MTAALDPLSAIGYLRLLSNDLTAVCVRDGGGLLLAGEPPGSNDGTPLSVRSDELTIEAAVGPRGCPGLLRHDLATALVALSR